MIKFSFGIIILNNIYKTKICLTELHFQQALDVYNSSPFSMNLVKSFINLTIGAPSITSWSIKIVIFKISLILISLSITTGFFMTDPIPKETG